MTLPDTPLSDVEFSALMAACGPFEDTPVVAVAVSGGADSMALAVLAQGWAQAIGGRVQAFTVDHGLRPESEAEAQQVASWLNAYGIDHQILSWRGPKPSRSIQEKARDARYALLTEACRAHGILHLLLAHHADDQTETVLIRAARGSGVEGLRGMLAISAPPLPGPRWPRAARPLLPVAKARLVATLSARGLSWIEDPSNHNALYTRVRLRQTMDQAQQDEAAKIAVAARLETAALHQALGPVLAAAVTLSAAGHADIEPGVLAAAPVPVQQAAWARLFRTVSGREYTPRSEMLATFLDRQAAPGFAGATLAGCQLTTGKLWRLAREPAGVVTVPATQAMLWDNRFSIVFEDDSEFLVGRYTVGPLSPQGRDAFPHLPAVVRAGLPAIYDGGKFVGLPHIAGLTPLSETVPIVARIRAVFTPPHALLW